jgi:hypothetical protein
MAVSFHPSCHLQSTHIMIPYGTRTVPYPAASPALPTAPARATQSETMNTGGAGPSCGSMQNFTPDQVVIGVARLQCVVMHCRALLCRALLAVMPWDAVHCGVMLCDAL